MKIRSLAIVHPFLVASLADRAREGAGLRASGLRLVSRLRMSGCCQGYVGVRALASAKVRER